MEVIWWGKLFWLREVLIKSRMYVAGGSKVQAKYTLQPLVHTTFRYM